MGHGQAEPSFFTGAADDPKRCTIDGRANCRFLLERDAPDNEMANWREEYGESAKKREEDLGLQIGEDQVEAGSGR